MGEGLDKDKCVSRGVNVNLPRISKGNDRAMAIISASRASPCLLALFCVLHGTFLRPLDVQGT